jgi:hypothetical protein
MTVTLAVLPPYPDRFGLSPAQGEVIAANAYLDRITQRGKADHFDHRSGSDSQLEEPLVDGSAAGDVAHHIALTRP